MRAKITLGLATRFPSGRKSNAERKRLAAVRSAAQVTTAPEWPRDGYSGSGNARLLEAEERKFITELAAPLSLEDRLAHTVWLNTGKLLSNLSVFELTPLLTNFVAEMERYVADRLAEFASLEVEFRPDDGEATAQRLARLQWEADGYLSRLRTARTLYVMAAQEREQQSREKTMELSRTIVAGRDQAGIERDIQPREHYIPLTIDPRAKNADLPTQDTRYKRIR